MEEERYLKINGFVALLATFLSAVMMAETNDYTYLFLVVVAGIVGFRDLKAALTIFDGK